jgi:hypothetical protein
MKASFVLSFAVFVRQVFSGDRPQLQWDPDTVKDCVGWYDNGLGKTCEAMRSLFGSTLPTNVVHVKQILIP